MKKRYITPQMTRVKLHLEGVIAASIGISEETVNLEDAFSGDLEDEDWSEE